MRGTKTLHDSALAQLVEQMTVNHWVAGSSPAGGAKYQKGCTVCSLFITVDKPNYRAPRDIRSLHNYAPKPLCKINLVKLGLRQ
jgi:hypothetical protein